MKRILWIFLITIMALFLCQPVLAVEDESNEGEITTVVRENLTKSCKYKAVPSSLSASPLKDSNLKSNVIMPDQGSVSWSWKEEVSADVVYGFSYVLPDSFTVIQKDGSGNVILEKDFLPERHCFMFPLENGCRSVTLKSNGRCKLNAFQIYSAGDRFPVDTVYWTEPEENDESDLMLFTTHFDDEILMMGAVLPLYAGQQNKDVIIAVMKGTDELRKMEEYQSAWALGVKREPLCFNFSSNSLGRAVKNAGNSVMEKDNLEVIVGLLRQYRPLVVVTHDVNGEYGHESHIKTSSLVRRAVEIAGDAGFYPESADAYGIWQVQKLYIHLWEERPLVIDEKQTLGWAGGKTVFKVCQDAFAFHKTQQKNWSVAKTNAKYPIGQFGLYYTAVGDDTPGLNDMFEHTGRKPVEEDIALTEQEHAEGKTGAEIKAGY